MELNFYPKHTLRRTRPIVPCAQCGDRLFAPEWSEYVDERSIRHLWSCDGCGYRFESLVRYPDIEDQAAQIEAGLTS